MNLSTNLIHGFTPFSSFLFIAISLHKNFNPVVFFKNMKTSKITKLSNKFSSQL